MRRLAVIPAAALAGLAVVAPATAAWAPSNIATAWERQTALGYTPCRPIVSPLPADLVADGTLADANNGEQSGECEIRIAANLPDDAIEWVAWHEMCHLSTVADIYASGDLSQLADPAHQHPLFKQCLRFGPSMTGGY
jgi:hypothetical protein